MIAQDYPSRNTPCEWDVQNLTECNNLHLIIMLNTLGKMQQKLHCQLPVSISTIFQKPIRLFTSITKREN